MGNPTLFWLPLKQCVYLWHVNFAFFVILYVLTFVGVCIWIPWSLIPKVWVSGASLVSFLLYSYPTTCVMHHWFSLDASWTWSSSSKCTSDTFYSQITVSTVPLKPEAVWKFSWHAFQLFWLSLPQVPSSQSAQHLQSWELGVFSLGMVDDV
jgi:hypothetical protein